jgi:hypothetical protein
MTRAVYFVMNLRVYLTFFYCCVARVTWENVYEVCGRILGTDFESVAKLWFQGKKLKAINIVTTAGLYRNSGMSFAFRM